MLRSAVICNEGHSTLKPILEQNILWPPPAVFYYSCRSAADQIKLSWFSKFSLSPHKHWIPAHSDQVSISVASCSPSYSPLYPLHLLLLNFTSSLACGPPPTLLFILLPLLLLLLLLLQILVQPDLLPGPADILRQNERLWFSNTIRLYIYTVYTHSISVFVCVCVCVWVFR